MHLELEDGITFTRARALEIPKNARRRWFQRLRDYIITRGLNTPGMNDIDLPDVLWAIDALEKELC